MKLRFIPKISALKTTTVSFIKNSFETMLVINLVFSFWGWDRISIKLVQLKHTWVTFTNKRYHYWRHINLEQHPAVH